MTRDKVGLMQRDFSNPRLLQEVDRAIVCFPIRAAADAHLQGVEIRSFASSSVGMNVPAVLLARADCSPLDVDQLEWVLGASSTQAQATLHETPIWVPVSVRAISRPWVKSLLGSWLGAPHWGPGRLTIAFSENDAVSDSDALGDCVDALAPYAIRVALTDVSQPDAIESVASRVLTRIHEVRLSGTCMNSAHAGSLASTVAGLRRRGILVTALDLSNVRQCELAIRADVDLLQGDVIGRAHGLARVENPSRGDSRAGG